MALKFLDGLRKQRKSVSPFCRPAFFGGCDDSSAALRAQVSLARLAICAWRCYFCQGTLPRYLPKGRYGAIDRRSLRLKFRNDILDVIHSRSFLWQLKWDLSNPATLVANCLCNLTTRSCLSARRQTTNGLYEIILNLRVFAVELKWQAIVNGESVRTQFARKRLAPQWKYSRLSVSEVMRNKPFSILISSGL